MSVDPYVAGLAMKSGGNIENLTPGERLDLENAMGPNLTAAQLGDIAQGKMPPGMNVGGDTMAPDSVAAMYDRQMAQRGSTVSDKDLALAEMHARQGNEVQAANVAGGAGALDAATDRAQLQQAGADYMMNARPGESVQAYEDRVKEEAKQNDGQEKGGMGWAAALGGMFMAAYAGSKERIGALVDRFSPQDKREVDEAGYALAANTKAFEDLGAPGTTHGLGVALDRGPAQTPQGPQVAIAQARENDGGMMRALT